MTKKIGQVIVIEPEVTICARCGDWKDTRDMQRNGVRICFECSTENEREEYVRWLFDLQ